MKKHIAFMISCIMLAVCFCFPGYALEYYAYTDNTSFDYGDVLLSAKLTGVVSNNSGSNSEYGWDFDYTFSVTLINKTSDFQVADSNNFMFLFNSGYSDYFTKAQFANAFELLESSDNTSNIRWEGYGSVLRFTFSDSELLVLNPNETRTYTFLIRQHFPFNVNIAWYNNSINQSSLTYNSASSITINTKPSAFTSNTVEDFLNNDSFPNSIIPWLMASYEQGVVDQQKYDRIIDILTYQYQSYQLPGVSVSGVNNGYYTKVQNGLNILGSFFISHPYIVNYDVEYASETTLYNAYYAVETYYFLRITNSNDYAISYPFRLNFNHIFTYSNLYGTFLGSKYEYVDGDLVPINYVPSLVADYFTVTSNNYSNSDLTNVIDGKSSQYIIVKSIRYFGTNDTFSITYNSHTFGLPDMSTSANVENEYQDIIDQNDQIHQQEQEWYTQNEAAIEATGLSNFEFSSGELDGLTQLRLQFAQVWGALGDWTLVYIFVLSLSLATFILRHRPTTKAQQRMSDSVKYRQEVRNRWAALDARASNNSNGFSDEIWRRAGYL